MGNPNEFFTDKQNLKTIDTYRITYVAIFIVAFIFTEIGRFIYRPYIYSNNINDCGIADTVGNWGGIIVQIFLSLAILNSPKQKAYRVVAFITFGYTVYEIIQPILPRGTYDILDIYGTIVGGIFSTIIFLFVHFFIKENRIIYRF